MNPLVFRNNRLFLALMMFGSLAASALSLCMLLLAFSALTPLSPFSLDRLIGFIEWLFGSVSFAAAVPWLFLQRRRMRYYQARMDANGIEFRFGTKQAPKNIFIEWKLIRSIQTMRRGRTDIYRIGAESGGWAEYDGYAFFRPKKLAREIAARTNLPIGRVREFL